MYERPLRRHVPNWLLPFSRRRTLRLHTHTYITRIDLTSILCTWFPREKRTISLTRTRHVRTLSLWTYARRTDRNYPALNVVRRERKSARASRIRGGLLILAAGRARNTTATRSIRRHVFYTHTTPNTVLTHARRGGLLPANSFARSVLFNNVRGW